MTAAMYLSQLSPELSLIVGGCVALLVGISKRSFARAVVAPLAIVVVIVSMLATAQYGSPSGDPNPVGLAFTPMSLYVRWITLSVGLLIVLVNWHLPVLNERGEFFGMILFSLSGVMLTACANDLVVLFFAIELVSVPTYVLVALSRTDARASEASVKYFFLGALAAAITVYGFSFLYGAAGTTVLKSASGNSLASYVSASGSLGTMATVGLVLAFAGLSFKVAAVPFHAYVADVYEGAASPVTALLGFLPKLAGFVVMIKLLDAMHWDLPGALLWLLWMVAAVTMTAGNVLALLQKNVKRMLAYSSVAHTGYMLIGVLVGPTMGEGPMNNGVAALLFYIVVYGVMNLGAFAVLASLNSRGKCVETLDDLAGVSQAMPLSALALAVCAFSLMGFPPTAGFLGKVYLFSSAFSVNQDHVFHSQLVVLAVIAVVNSAIGAAYYLRIAAACYFRTPATSFESWGGFPVRLAAAACAIAMIVGFLLPTPLAERAQIAAGGRLAGPHTLELFPADSPMAASVVDVDSGT